MAEVFHLGADNYWWTAASGLAGLLMGFCPVILGFFVPAGLVMIVFLAILILFVALDVEKNKVVAHVLCMVNLNIVLNVHGVLAQENLLPALGSYALGVAVTAGIIYGLRALALNAAKKKAAQDPA
jgi:hypothetical protein